jgi:hypothetical protein
VVEVKAFIDVKKAEFDSKASKVKTILSYIEETVQE